MNGTTIGMALVLVVAMLGSVGVAAANHDGGEECDNLNNALDAINESADDEAEENNAVERAQDECEGEHHQEEANQGSDNADGADENRQD